MSIVDVRRTKAGREMVQMKWQKPPAGHYKVNSDAACFKDGAVGFGGIMRDAEGDVMVATCHHIGGVFTAEEAEALAARHALVIALEAGLRMTVLESDCLKLISHLKEGKRENSCFGNIVLDIMEIGESCTSLNFSHVSKIGNVVAHKLAKLSHSFGEIRVWIEEAPLGVMADVRNDLFSDA